MNYRLQVAKKHLCLQAEKRPIHFFVFMTITAVLIKIPFAPLILGLGMPTVTEDTLQGGVLLVIMSFVFLPIETLIGQTFPIWVGRRLRMTRWRSLCILSAIVFGAIHLGYSAGAFFVGFSTGLVLSLCWLIWREHSFMRALVRTTLLHAAHNFVAFTMYGIATVIS